MSRRQLPEFLQIKFYRKVELKYKIYAKPFYIEEYVSLTDTSSTPPTSFKLRPTSSHPPPPLPTLACEDLH